MEDGGAEELGAPFQYLSGSGALVRKRRVVERRHFRERFSAALIGEGCGQLRQPPRIKNPLHCCKMMMEKTKKSLCCLVLVSDFDEKAQLKEATIQFIWGSI